MITPESRFVKQGERNIAFLLYSVSLLRFFLLIAFLLYSVSLLRFFLL